MNFLANILKIPLRSVTSPTRLVTLRFYCAVTKPSRLVCASTVLSCRKVSSTPFCLSEEQGEEETNGDAKKAIDPSKDRTRVIPPEVSIRYMNSKAYHTTYGDEPVWVPYRRNFPRQFMPKTTRMTCIQEGMIKTGSPCPICRDEYLVVHYTNVKLLKQFICPHSGEVLTMQKTNVCQVKYFDLQVAIEQAKDHGLITWDVPFRIYNYEEYYPQLKEQ